MERYYYSVGWVFPHDTVGGGGCYSITRTSYNTMFLEFFYCIRPACEQIVAGRLLWWT